MTRSTSPVTGQATNQSECSMPCSGDSLETCGAGNRVQVFSHSTSSLATTTASSSVSPLFTTIPVTWSRLACYTDSVPHRILKGLSIVSASNTPARCISTCQSKGFTYAGVEFGAQFFHPVIAFLQQYLLQGLSAFVGIRSRHPQTLAK